MEDVQKFSGMNTLPSGSLHKRWYDTVGFKSGVRAGAETNLPEYHHLSQYLFGVIISGGDARNAQKGREMFLLRPAEKFSQRLSGVEPERFFADIAQFVEEALFDTRRLLPREFTGFQFLPHSAGTGAEINELVAENNDGRILFPDWQKRVFPADLFCIEDHWGQDHWGQA